MLPPNLYARVYLLRMRIMAHETAGAARTRSSLRPHDFYEGKRDADLGRMRRENDASYSVVVTRLVRDCALGRVTQYCRDSSD